MDQGDDEDEDSDEENQGDQDEDDGKNSEEEEEDLGGEDDVMKISSNSKKICKWKWLNFKFISDFNW